MANIVDEIVGAIKSGNVAGSDILVEPERVSGELFLSVAKHGDQYIISVSDGQSTAEESVQSMLPDILIELYRKQAEEAAKNAKIHSVHISPEDLEKLIDASYGGKITE